MWKDTKWIMLIFCLCLGACAFNFEITSQRTALENQVLGTYADIEDQVPIKRKIAGPEETTDKPKAADLSPTEFAKLNQQFNKPDIDDLKNDQIIGESGIGDLAILPKGVGLAAKAEKQRLKLADLLVSEENRDRSVLFRARIEENDVERAQWENLKNEVIRQLREDLKTGQWYQDEKGRWQQKLGPKE